MNNLISRGALHWDDLPAASRVRAVSPWEAWVNGATGFWETRFIHNADVYLNGRNVTGKQCLH